MQDLDRKITPSRKFLSSKEPRLVNYYIAMAIDIILLYFFNNIVFANIIFLSMKDLTSCLWAINLALGAGIIGNFVFLLFRPSWFRHLVQAVLNALALLAVYTVFRIFPFVLNTDILRTVTKVVLVVIMAGIGLGFVIELIKSGFAWTHRAPPPTPPISPVSPPLPESSSDSTTSAAPPELPTQPE